MKSAPNLQQVESARVTAGSISRFIGTSNPRHLRAIKALLAGTRTREQLDGIVGCSNGPNLVAELRALGLTIPCKRERAIDRDGREVMRGVYRLASDDFRKLFDWYCSAEYAEMMRGR
jgi:hypothetical protein